MGLEFMPIFEEWALDYDEEVNGGNLEYQEVFANYWQILDEIAALSGDTVLEFGSGTGNLTEKLDYRKRNFSQEIWKIFPCRQSQWIRSFQTWSFTI